MKHLILLLLPLCAYGQYWDTQQCPPHQAVVFFMGADSTRTIGTGVVVVAPDTLRQIADWDSSKSLYLDPWLSVGDTLQFYLLGLKQGEFCIVQREAWISKTK